MKYRKLCFKCSYVRFELIFLLFAIPKCDLSEVEKSIYHVVARHSELIISLLTTSKCGLC